MKNLKMIPVYRECGAANNGGCFCTGACNEVIGYIKEGVFESVEQVDPKIKDQLKQYIFDRSKDEQ